MRKVFLFLNGLKLFVFREIWGKVFMFEEVELLGFVVESR